MRNWSEFSRWADRDSTVAHWERYFPGHGEAIVWELLPLYAFVERGPTLGAPGRISPRPVAFWRNSIAHVRVVDVAGCDREPCFGLADSLWRAFDGHPARRRGVDPSIKIWEALGQFEERGVENKTPRPMSNGRRQQIWSWVAPSLLPTAVVGEVRENLKATVFWAVRAVLAGDEPERFRPLIGLWATGVLVLGTSGDTLLVTRPSSEVGAASGTEPDQQVA